MSIVIVAADRISAFVLGLIALWAILFLVLSRNVTLFAVLSIVTAIAWAFGAAWSSKQADPGIAWREAFLERPRQLSSAELVNELQARDSPPRSR